MVCLVLLYFLQLSRKPQDLWSGWGGGGDRGNVPDTKHMFSFSVQLLSDSSLSPTRCHKQTWVFSCKVSDICVQFIPDLKYVNVYFSGEASTLLFSIINGVHDFIINN